MTLDTPRSVLDHTGMRAVRVAALNSAAVGRSAAFFFDLDKTVIAKSSALAFGRPFYRDG